MRVLASKLTKYPFPLSTLVNSKSPFNNISILCNCFAESMLFFSVDRAKHYLNQCCLGCCRWRRWSSCWNRIWVETFRASRPLAIILTSDSSIIGIKKHFSSVTIIFCPYLPYQKIIIERKNTKIKERGTFGQIET